MKPITVARFYLKGCSGGFVVLNIPGTSYEVRIPSKGTVVPSAQGRVWGTLRLPVWKLDVVTAGGAYIEPVYGKPRRVQGKVVGTLPELNGVVVEVCGQPIVGLLPERWQAVEVEVGSRVGLDIAEGGEFVPEPARANREPEVGAVPSVNIGVG